jgi:tetratricopeptide (TPR) repeat protein
LRRDTSSAAFANVNGAIPDHPLYFEAPPPAALLRPDLALRPAGPMKVTVPKGQENAIDLKYWREPLPAEELARFNRRARAQFNEYLPDTVRVTPETFEHRFLRDLIRARQNLADWHARAGTVDGFRRSAEIYESILAIDPEMRSDRGVVYNLAGAYFGMKRYDLAEPWLKQALELELPPPTPRRCAASSRVVCRETNRPDEAARWAERAKGYR